ncbi:MAG: FHA domain-containing protein [Rhodospirillaceae bacterium]
MANQNCPFILKLLSGPHLGAEVELGPGEYLLGRDDACDIVLSDHDLAFRHARLILSDSGMAIAALDGPVTVGGQAIGGKSVPVPPFQVVTLGAMQCRLGPAGIPWPPIAPPDAIVPEAVAVPVAVAVDVPAPSHDVLPQTSEAGGAGKTEGKVVTRLWSRQSFPWLRHIAGLIVLAVIGTVALNLRPQTTALPAAVPVADVAGRATAVIVRLGFGDRVSAREDENRKLLIEGYLDNEDQRQVLIDALADAGISGLLGLSSVWTRELMVSSARDVLVNRGFTAQIGYRAPGVLILTGSVADTAALDPIAQALTSDIMGVRAVENATTSIKGEALPIAQMTQISPATPATPVAGAAPAAPAEAIADATLSLPIRSVTLGRLPFLVLEDGRTYLVGGVLDNQMVIRYITSRTIVLSLDGQTTVYSYRR